MAFNIPYSYYNALANVESSGNPFAKASTSSASGLFQFVQSTGKQFGLNWGSNSSQPFGGAYNSVGQQFSAIDALTQQNASGLAAAGQAVTGNSLYAAHFLGVGNAVSVLSSPSSTQLSSILPSNVLQANPFLNGMSVGDFTSWIGQKGGSAFSQSNIFRRWEEHH